MGDTSPASTASEPEVVLEDSFDDNGNEWISPPPEVTTAEDGSVSQELGAQPGDAVISISEGALRFDVATPGAPWFWPSALADQAQELTDQRVEVSVQMAEPAAAGVACRIVNTGAPGDASHYELGINSAGVHAIFRIGADPDDVERLAIEPPDLPADPDPGDEIDEAFAFDPAATYTIAAECTGGQDGEPTHLSLFVNGEEVLTADDPDPIEAGVGGVWVSQTGLLDFQVFEATFDDWTMSRL